MAAWWCGRTFCIRNRFRQRLREVLPHCPTSPNAYDPTDVALGYVGGILCGADKLSRVAWLQSDPALSQVLGVEAIASQSTLSRFFDVFGQKTCNALNGLHRQAVGSLPSLKDGYTLDLDSWSLLHEDGHQQGVAVGYTRQGLKPCHRPLLAALAESKLIANYWLRRGDSPCANGAAEFLRQTVQGLPAHIRLKLVRGDAGFGEASVQDMAQALGLKFIFVARLTQKIQSLCRHDEAHWQRTEIPGLEVQEVELEQPGRRLIVVRQRIEQRPDAGGKTLLEVPGYRFQALVTNLPRSVDALNGLAPIQWSGGHRKSHQRTGPAVWHQAAVRRELLGHRGDASSGDRRLQPLRAVATALGSVGKMRTEHLALAVVWPGGGVEPRAGQTHTQTGGARSGSSNVVARNPDQTHGFAQLQCSCLAASMNPPILLKMTVQLNRSGLDRRIGVLCYSRL